MNLSLPTVIARAIVTVATVVVIDRVRNSGPEQKALGAAKVGVTPDYVIIKNPHGSGTVRVPILKAV